MDTPPPILAYATPDTGVRFEDDRVTLPQPPPGYEIALLTIAFLVCLAAALLGLLLFLGWAVGSSREDPRGVGCLLLAALTNCSAVVIWRNISPPPLVRPLPLHHPPPTRRPDPRPLPHHLGRDAAPIRPRPTRPSLHLPPRLDRQSGPSLPAETAPRPPAAAYERCHSLRHAKLRRRPPPRTTADGNVPRPERPSHS